MAGDGTFSRRGALRWAGSTLGLLAVVWPTEHSAAQQKVSKTDAKYQDKPNGQQRCEICLYFQPPGSCRLVAETISPKGWCQFFSARENAH